MWVYQQTGTPAHLPEAALLPQPQKTLPPERSAPEVPSPLQRHNTETRQKTCWLLVCAFLIGSGSAGVLLAFCEKQQPDWLQYYLQSWRGLFAAADAHTAASLFGMEYLTLAAATTLLFLMGFSALGPVLIFLFMMFYGLGNGSLYAAHCLPPPFTAAAWGASARSRWNSREKKPFRVGLLVASMTRISTMAYTSMR